MGPEVAPSGCDLKTKTWSELAKWLQWGRRLPSGCD